jgi:predicted neuraminidase
MIAMHNESSQTPPALLSTLALPWAAIHAIGFLAGVLLLSNAASGQGNFEAEFLFDPALESHGHVHASCIIEGPNGDLRAVWYENGPRLPAPYFSGQQDKSDDVRIGSARKAKDAKAWDKPFVTADTFGISDNNPCMAVDKQNRLWLIYPTLLGAPEWSWGSALVRYKVSSDFDKPGPPVWNKQNILVPHVVELRKFIKELADKAVADGKQTADQVEARMNRLEARSKSNPLIERLGWMPRAHPLVRSDGALVVPLSNENFNIAAMAITKDGGETWTFSSPVPEIGLTQPTLVEVADGTILAFFRNGGGQHRIKRSESKDGGLTWGPVTVTDRPHPGAGIEAIMLKNGHLALIYNDTEKERDKLAISISSDNGTTWPWTRHLENTPKGRFDYPSIIQSMDGSIQVTYSYNLKTIRHAHFDEAWVQGGDK